MKRLNKIAIKKNISYRKVDSYEKLKIILDEKLDDITKILADCEVLSRSENEYIRQHMVNLTNLRKEIETNLNKEFDHVKATQLITNANKSRRHVKSLNNKLLKERQETLDLN